MLGRRQLRYQTTDSKLSTFDKIFGPQTVEAKPSFKNRWLIVAPAFMTHMCIGSPWAWSALSGTLAREHGFVTSAAMDWSLSETTFPLSIVFGLQGISAAFAGKWQMKVGARLAMTVAGLCFGGGLLIGSVGVSTHNLWLLYLGYGVLGGCGVGIAYTPPLQCLISWFPDRKGLASGMTIAGFGSGALLFAPLSGYLMRQFATMPQYLGPVSHLTTVTKDGRLFADMGGQLKEIVVASSADLAALPYKLAEGAYVVGTGSTGAAPALAVCGGFYLCTMLGAAFAIRKPAAGYVPAGYTPPAESTTAGSSYNVNVDTVMKTPQFWALASMFFCIGTGGMGLFSVAKPMMTEVFSGSLPTLVTASFATSYLLMLSAGNLLGRLGWAAFSDKFGRRTTFHMFTLGSIPLYLAVPFCVKALVSDPSVVPLYVFCTSTVLAISFMGGTYAILPAYEADLFGAKYVGAIHGRFLLASTAAALAGPSILLTLRSRSQVGAMQDLLAKADPVKFQQVYSVPISQAQQLIEAKTLTIPKLMQLVPVGTPNPTPFLYDTTMYTMAGFMAVAAICHSVVKPIDPKYFEK
jgi:MFS family permease